VSEPSGEESPQLVNKRKRKSSTFFFKKEEGNIVDKRKKRTVKRDKENVWIPVHVPSPIGENNSTWHMHQRDSDGRRKYITV